MTAPGAAAALEQAATEQNCAEINLKDSSEFNRVWIWCAVYTIILFVGPCVPYYWFGRFVKEDLEETSEEEAADKGEKEEGDAEDAHSKGLEARKAKLRTSATDSTDFTRGDADPAPNLEAARAHLKASSPSNQEDEWWPLYKTNATDLALIGGPGLALYFQLLKNLGFCFSYMAAVAAPIGGFSMIGDFATDTGQTMIKTTLGNLGTMPTNGLSPFRRYLIIGCQGVLVEKLTKAFGWLDLWAITMFLGFLVYFRFVRVPKTQREADENLITTTDFSVEIDNLPRDLGDKHALYETSLKEFLTKCVEELRNTHRGQKLEYPGEAKVVEVVLVRDFSGRLCDKATLAGVLRDKRIAEYKKDEKRLDKLRKKEEKLKEKLDGREFNEDELPVVRAFAILNTTFDKENLLFAYRFANYSILRACQRPDKRFEGKAIRVREAPMPSDILWANQDVTWRSRVARAAVIGLVFILIIIVSMLVIYTTTAWSMTVKGKSLTYLGYEECDPIDQSGDTSPADCTVQAVNLLTAAEAVAQNKVDCFCAAQGYTTILNDSEVRSVCSDYYSNLGTTMGIAVGASVVVVLINLVVKTVLVKLSAVERPLSITELNSSKMFKVFVAQYINTACVLLLVNWAAPSGLQNLVPPPLLRGSYPDLTREWYANVGVSVLTTMSSNVIVPAAGHLAEYILTVGRRRFKTGSTVSKGHQAELIELYTNPEFDISARFSVLLNTVFCTLMYSSGMPLLLPLAAAFMFVTYWMDKLSLLWGSKQPPAFDTTMAKEASEYMLYAVGIHCLFALFMLGQPCTVPASELSGNLGSLSDQAQAQSGDYASNGIFGKISERLGKETTWMLFALLLILVALWLLWTVLWVVGETFGELAKCFMVMCCSCRSSAKIAPEDKANRHSFDKVAEELEKVCPPASYRLARNPYFVHLASYLDEVDAGVGDDSSQPREEEGPRIAADEEAVASPAPASPNERLGESQPSDKSSAPSAEPEA